MNHDLMRATDLSVTFSTHEGPVQAVRHLDFRLGQGETLGIVGESGSGKSTVALAVLGLLSRNATVAGSINCQGRELVGLSEDKFAQIRGETIAFVPQDPLSSLNPAFRVGWQVSEAIWAHGKMSREQADQRAIELLDLVGIPHAAQRA